MDTRQLELFLAIGQAGGYRMAAQARRLSQSALSRQIQALEAELGVALFDRSRRGAHLTPAGETFRAEAARLLARVEGAVSAVRASAEGRTGRLSIGYVGPTLYSMVPRMLRRFRRAFPGVSLRLRKLSTTRQLEELERETLDVGFRSVVGLPAGVEGRTLATERVIMALPADHRLATSGAVPLAELADDAFIMQEPEIEPELNRLFYVLCQRAGFVPRVEYRAGGAFDMLAFVTAGLGVSFAPATLRQRVRIRDVVFRELDPPGPEFPHGIVWNARNDNPALAQFLQVVERRERSRSSDLGAPG